MPNRNKLVIPRKTKVSCPFCLDPETPQERERDRVQGLVQEKAEVKREKEKGLEEFREQERLKAIARGRTFKKLSAAKKRAKRRKGIFVTPEEFNRRFDKFLTQDLPGGLGVALGGFTAAGVELPLVILAGATGLSKIQQAKTFGPSRRRKGDVSEAEEKRRIKAREVALKRKRKKEKKK